ncbi:hypothetical protein [Candidatus Mycolicibacterium alkanivorans]|uniref:Uncharacterized protein n=1 Tax=Candidatus Mycolicibacterium alkanivorans TaxID=2954114 RepID=A0ABS9YQN2_9MYCO|nr:hypothetical protein [Candidatus Mycolicibacterium alkanivorans]MCI4673517.1 hypothetical protein [Candidatus Mycolicibacterium alkanivorans]
MAEGATAEPGELSESVKVGQLLLGTAAGCLSLGLCFYWFWGIAWIIPTALAVFTLPWQPTRWIGIGFAAAALGALVAITLALHLSPGAEEVTPQPSTTSTDPAASSQPVGAPASERLCSSNTAVPVVNG